MLKLIASLVLVILVLVQQQQKAQARPQEDHPEHHAHGHAHGHDHPHHHHHHGSSSSNDATAAKCPEYGPWLPWSKKCVRWTTLAEMRNDFSASCQKSNNRSHIEADVGYKMPQQCGHCSVRIRCRTRDRGQKGQRCFPLDPQMETCHEYGDVCTMDKHPEVGCNWNQLSVGLKTCSNQIEGDDYRRDSLNKFSNQIPDMNCFEKDGKCKCCCHPYRPNKEGTECVRAEQEAQCDSLGEYNQWSQCLWYPLRNVTDGVRAHCHLGVHTNEVLLPKPTGLELPEPCGYCSFKVRCKTREHKDGCFHIESDKFPCGAKDCPTCANVCTIPKSVVAAAAATPTTMEKAEGATAEAMENGKDKNGAGKCDWEQIFGKTSSHREQSTVFTKFPYWRLYGINRLRQLPRGICKEINGQCKCCCHPYEPNEDGTKCIPNALCLA